jgi:F0F1-type ATP synthase assembly protein I
MFSMFAVAMPSVIDHAGWTVVFALIGGIFVGTVIGGIAEETRWTKLHPITVALVAGFVFVVLTVVTSIVLWHFSWQNYINHSGGK